jgi:hypothetical protein
MGLDSKALTWRRRIGVVTVVGGVAALCTAATGVAASGAQLAKPTVSSLIATPSSLGSSGGGLTLSASVSDATSCTFSSNKPVVGLPATLPCSNGPIDESVTVPANAGFSPITYKFKLAVTGTKTVKAKTEVTVPSGDLITLNSQWTLQEFSLPHVPDGCSIQQFVSSSHWTDDLGFGGTYTGGGTYIEEISKRLFPPPAYGASATWSSATDEYDGTLWLFTSEIGTFTLSPGATPGC